MATQYMAVCTEQSEHGGKDYLLSTWLDSKDEANALGKEHELATKGHRWRIDEREKPQPERE